MTGEGIWLNIDRLVTPFWEGKEVFDETVMLLSENGEIASAKLFYKPEKILSVKSTDNKIEYKEGLDWVYHDGRIVMINGSYIPYMRKEDCHFYEKEHEDCFEAKDGGYILYKTKGYFHKRQLAITYTHNDSFDFGLLKTDDKMLERTKGKLKKGENIRVCFYGDSITAGCDGSGAMGIEPYMPGWPELLKQKLESTYKSKIEIINTAVGGKRTDWGLECAEERIAKYRPDLAVIAFGMNDGTEKVLADDFRSNIEQIKDKVLEQNKDTEFIFISTTLPNPDSVFDGYQMQYYNELIKCARKCDTVLNMTSIHSKLLERKRFIDMTGNNINHPNDFLIRIYAQAMINLFI